MAEETGQSQAMLLHERLDALCVQLGYAERPTFYTVRSISAGGHVSHVMRQALSAIGINGIFALDDGFPRSAVKPIVYVGCASNTAELQSLRKDVWSQGAAPFLLVVMPETVEICNGFQPPTADKISVEYDPYHGTLSDTLVNYTADRISSSITWANFEIHRDASVDNSLVMAIEALNRRARSDFPELKKDRDLINALIGKFLYIYVLIDRGILSKNWLVSQLPVRDRSSATDFINAIFDDSVVQPLHYGWTAQSVMSVFDAVDGAINGSVFHLSDEQRTRIPNGICHLVHRVIRRGDVLSENGAQLSFLNVSFHILRTETISAIYERFVSIENEDGKRDDGVFYTPPHLVDHVLDRVEAVSPITNKANLIDPAAGSGIFLVGAYRRLMERHAPAAGWAPQHIGQAKLLLLNSIHGIEKHPQAANVCRFSLYLTLLDYVGRASIEELIEAAGDEKFLPDLKQNVRSEDAFDRKGVSRQYTHVVGNPPWSTTDGQKDRTNQAERRKRESPAVAAFANELKEAKLSFGQNRLSDLFMWLANRHLAVDGGVIAFLLPAHSVVGRLAGSFAHSLARNATLKWVGNLSHLRRKLFIGVEAPACVVVAVNRPPTNSDRVAIYRPLLSSLPGGRKSEIWGLLASHTDIQYQRSKDFQEGSNGWFTQTMLSGFDRRMHEALATWGKMNRQTLGHFLERCELCISKGGSPTETGVVRRTAQGKAAQLLPLSREDLLKVAPDYRGFYSGNVILIPRSMNEATYHREPMAYPSTFNAIIPMQQYERSLEYPIPEDQFIYLNPGFVKGFLVYLNSTVVRYFASLFGASYLMDKARLEKNDLLTFPCPFHDLDDKNLHALATSSSPDDLILDAMSAGADFRVAFEEFSVFRRHFANAQVPQGSLDPATDQARKLYLERLVAEIQSSFDRRLQISASVDAEAEQYTYVTVEFGKRLLPDKPKTDVTGRFLGTSIVVFDRENRTALIIKSPTRQAWTIDQAVTDAITLGREIRSIQ